MVSYKPLLSISEEEVSLLLQKQNLPAIPSLPVSSMIQAPPFIFFFSKPLPFPFYCRLLPRFNSLPSQSQKQNNSFCSSPPPAALLLFQISTHQLFLWFSYKSVQPFLESITKSQGDLRSLTWPPSSIWMAGHSLSTWFPSQSSLLVLRPLTTNQDSLAGSSLDQPIGIGVSHGSSFPACYFNTTSWHLVTEPPGLSPDHLSSQPACFLQISQPTSFPSALSLWPPRWVVAHSHLNMSLPCPNLCQGPINLWTCPVAGRTEPSRTWSLTVIPVSSLPDSLLSIESESEVTQSCLTLCDPMDGSLPGSSVHSIFQARVLEWVAISFSRRSSQPRDQT